MEKKTPSMDEARRLRDKLLEDVRKTIRAEKMYSPSFERKPEGPMEKKPGYCDCPKVGTFFLNNELEHDVCGKRVIEDVPKKKPVFCAHPWPQIPDLKAFVFEVIRCELCGAEWKKMEEAPKRVIGYLEME